MAQIAVPRHDPEFYCPRCDHKFGPTEEYCHDCGLAPLADPADEAFYSASLDAWRSAHPA